MSRDGIGGNNPPPLEAMQLHVEDLFATVSGSTASEVKTDEQEAALDELLETVRLTRKDADAKRVEAKKPHDDAAKAVQAAWKPLLDRLDAATAALKDAVTPYRLARQKAKDEEARKAREAAEAERLAAQKALKESDDLEERFAAEERLKHSSKLEAVANRIDRSATGLRSRQIAVITDRKALLQHVMKTDPDALTDWLQAYAQRGLPSVLPGVEVQTERKAA